MGLGSFSEKELREELERRKEATKEKHLRDHRAYAKKVVKGVTMATVEVFAPRHLMSCSDDNLANGWGTESDGMGARCNRCAMMEVAQEGYLPFPFIIDVEFRRSLPGFVPCKEEEDD